MSTESDLSPDFFLYEGVRDTRSFGNKFNGTTNQDGDITAEFQATGDDDVYLSLTGYDIDFDDEIEIFVNGTSIGYLSAGVNEGTSSYLLSISSDLLIEGDNTITFAQTGPTTWKWGVTDFLLESVAPVAHLTAGELETGTFGNNYNGSTDLDGRISMTFDATGDDDLVLSFGGYDIDFDNEVEVLLNGESLGLLSAGVDEGVANYDFILTAGNLQTGTNTLEFVQVGDISWKWGVTNVMISDLPAPPAPEQDLVALQVGVTDTGAYGNKFEGNTEADGVVKFGFENTGADLLLTFDGYDIDFDDEVEIFINDVSVGFVSVGVNEGLSGHEILLRTVDLEPGENVIAFKQATDVTWKWGVTNLSLSEVNLDQAPVAHLTAGELETGTFGNNYNGSTDLDGRISMTFDATGDDDLVLSFGGYDIDFDNEVEVLLNGESLGLLSAGVDEGVANYDFILTAGNLQTGTNTLEFVQVGDISWKWGVTNVMISDLPAPPAPEQDLVALQVGVTETGAYGNKFEGNTEADGVVKFGFENTGADLLLTFDGYDIDFDDEVEIFINDVSVGFVSVGVNEGLSGHEILLRTVDLEPGENVIAFKQATDVTWKWGVTNLSLSEVNLDQAPVILEIGKTDDGSYGNKFDGSYDSDGVQIVTFESSGDPLQLTFAGFDIDGSNEVELILNGRPLGMLTLGMDEDYSYYKIILPSDLQVTGQNTVEFRQLTDVAFKWGITDIRLDLAPETYSPEDTAYAEQWHFDTLGEIERIWADYTGEAVTVGIYDNGVDYMHHDLNDNYDAGLHVFSSGIELDPLLGTAEHGTAVAGIIASENNGVGTVGIAFDATLSGVDIIGGSASAGSSDLSGYIDALENLVAFDLVNHSWGATPGFDQSAETRSLFDVTVAYFEAAVEAGREDLGTIMVKSAGNASANSAGDMIDSSRTTISVAAVNDAGEPAIYSNFGSNILISAYSSDPYTSTLGIKTTDLQGDAGYATGDYTGSDSATGFGGTSASAPIVSGVIALMLEANPSLGWRDVQTILAYSSNHTSDNIGEADPFFDLFGLGIGYDWKVNGADNWNGGGLHYSEAIGYGTVDVFAAVRMAEVWSLHSVAQTSSNELHQTFYSTAPITITEDGTHSVSFSGAAMEMESVEISLTLTNAAVEVFLISAEGTRVQLLDEFDAIGSLTDWTFGAQAFRGEYGEGLWSLEFVGTGSASAVTDWEVNFYGAAQDADDVYHYNDEVFAAIIDDGNGNLSALAHDVLRMEINDNGGNDWIDLAAMTGNLDVSLQAGATATSDNVKFLSIAAGVVIENIVAGDGNDTLWGNDVDNAIHGMRGSDVIGGAGGNDVLYGGEGADRFVFSLGDDFDVISDFQIGLDTIELLNFGITDYSTLNIADDENQNATLSFNGSDQLMIADIDTSMLSASDFSFYDFAMV